ncbi:MAG: hypothetical protein LBS73_02055, partial [Campylobacteraceae bacterium]|nr:hypothetical protein [Campylobacteraceae bacterium]
MRKIVKLLSIASVLGLLVGCGGGGSSSGDEDVGRNTSIEENESTEENETIGDTKVTSCWPDICTDEDFDNIRSNVKGNYTLKNDIDLSKYAGWEPIGNESDPFTGILNGGKHTIKGLTFKSYNNAKHVGLFGYISGADIEDLTVQTTNPITIELS